MTEADMNAEIRWNRDVFGPDLRNRGFSRNLIHNIQQIIEAGFQVIRDRLNINAPVEANGANGNNL